MFGPKIILTREELYEKVWSMPVQKLAAEFGFSDRGLAKLCRRYRIPVPPRGYWARLQVGQRVKRTPLPAATQATPEKIEIYAHEPRTRLKRADSDAEEIPVIVVSEYRTLIHPLTLRIEKMLDASKKDHRGLIAPNIPSVTAPVQVSGELLPRALRILDTLLAAFEQENYEVSWPKPFYKPLTVTVLDEPLTFAISESVTRTEREPSAARRPEAWYQAQRWDYQSTGRLKLAIRGTEYLGLRCWWADGTKRRVESYLGEFMVSLVAVAKALKRQREAYAEAERRRAEERRREAEAAAVRAEYDRRAKAIVGFARSWEQSKSLLVFAERLSSLAGDQGLSDERRRDVKAMAEWATRHATHIDPFTHTEWMVMQFKEPPWS